MEAYPGNAAVIERVSLIKYGLLLEIEAGIGVLIRPLLNKEQFVVDSATSEGIARKK